MSDLPTEALAEVFGLGAVVAPALRKTSGWGGHNSLWQVTTSEGKWAIKCMGRPLAHDVDDAFTIELAAHEGGVPMPRPVPSVNNRCFEMLDGVHYRCHEWCDGRAKTNEDVSADEARQMGEVVARLHELRLPTQQVLGRNVDQIGGWRELAAAGRERNAPWAARLIEAEALLTELRVQPPLRNEDVVASHRDLNAHNVLFGETGLRLIDWDAAGPAHPSSERASFSVLWAQTHEGGYDEERCTAFLAGYREAGGMVSSSDADALTQWLDGLAWWFEQNVRLALDQDSEEQHQATLTLADAFLKGPQTVAERQQLFRHCVGQL